MKRIFTCIILLFLTGAVVKAQSVYQPYSYQFYQKLNAEVYSTKTRVHSSLKPMFADDSLLRAHYDSLMNIGGPAGRFFNEHQVDIKGNNSTFYADLLPEFSLSRDFSGKKNTNFGSLGLQLGGTIGSKFYYNVAAYENRAVLPDYLATYTNQTGIARGQAYAGVYGNEFRWSYITASVSYTPNKYLNISGGNDKTFIGDGYRSELLSDYASPYPFVKLTATLGNVKYMAMWAYFNDPLSDVIAGQGQRKKFGVFHYLDWNVSNRLSFGFFDSVIWGAKDDAGHGRGFDFTYINPVIFLRPVEASNGSPDNALIGLTGKYKITDGITAYGQFALDEFEGKNFFSSNGSSRNKYGWQLGFRGADMFGVKGLNYLIESNNVKPYTYSERASVINYSENAEPLAHPWGANFREIVGLLNYSYNRFDFSLEADYGHYGLDIDGLNYGKDLFQGYRDPARETGNYTGQGLTTNMIYFEPKIAYLLNPKYNLRLELGGIIRNEKNDQFTDKTSMFTFGIRSSFRSMYNDLVSYKNH